VRNRQEKVAVVLSREEVRALLEQLQGTPWLVAGLLYGSGLRLMEAMRLRVKDRAIERGEVSVREGKDGKDRVTMLPTALENPVRAHLGRLRGWYEEERRRARPGVSLPFALARKYPEAGTRQLRVQLLAWDREEAGEPEVQCRVRARTGAWLAARRPWVSAGMLAGEVCHTRGAGRGSAQARGSAPAKPFCRHAS
jgi:integrase